MMFFFFNVEVPVDCWIGGLLHCWDVFFSLAEVTQKMLDGVGWCWGGRGADKTNPRSQSGSISSPATSDMKEASFTKSDF